MSEVVSFGVCAACATFNSFALACLGVLVTMGGVLVGEVDAVIA